jgi:hypothetical protein
MKKILVCTHDIERRIYATLHDKRKRVALPFFKPHSPDATLQDGIQHYPPAGSAHLTGMQHYPPAGSAHLTGMQPYPRAGPAHLPSMQHHAPVGPVHLNDKKSGSIVNLLSALLKDGATFGHFYYLSRASMYAVSKDWKCIMRSSIYRKFLHNADLFDGIAVVFDAFELQRVWTAPEGSIIIVRFDFGGYSFEVIEPGDPHYLEAYASLPGTI